MDNEIIELHPPLVTFASIDYDGDPNQGPSVQNPPPPAPYDHKSAGPTSNLRGSNPNLVVVNRNDLESILVSKGGNAAQFAQAAQREQAEMAAAQAAQISSQNYHKQPIQPRHGQHYRVSKPLLEIYGMITYIIIIIRYLCIKIFFHLVTHYLSSQSTHKYIFSTIPLLWTPL